MPVVYSAVKRFDPGCGVAWRKFIDWSGLTQLREVVSLDGILRPTTPSPRVHRIYRAITLRSPARLEGLVV